MGKGPTLRKPKPSMLPVPGFALWCRRTTYVLSEMIVALCNKIKEGKQAAKDYFTKELASAIDVQIKGAQLKQVLLPLEVFVDSLSELEKHKTEQDKNKIRYGALNC